MSQLASLLPKVLDVLQARQELILDSEPLQPVQVEWLRLWQSYGNASALAKVAEHFAQWLHPFVETVRAKESIVRTSSRNRLSDERLVRSQERVLMYTAEGSPSNAFRERQDELLTKKALIAFKIEVKTS